MRMGVGEQGAGVGAREREQRIDQLGHPQRLGADDLERAAQLMGGSLAAQRQICFADQSCQRRAQLVGGVGGEALDPRHRAARFGEERVQDRRQLVPLVVRAAQGQGQFERAGPRGERLRRGISQRPKRSFREPETKGCRGSDHQRRAEQHRGDDALDVLFVAQVSRGSLFAIGLHFAVAAMRLPRGQLPLSLNFFRVPDHRDQHAAKDDERRRHRSCKREREPRAKREPHD